MAVVSFDMYISTIARFASASGAACRTLAALTLSAALAGCAAVSAATHTSRPHAPGMANPRPARIYIIGQDLESIRGYFASGCCARPDGVTNYLDLYELRSRQSHFGGLGMDTAGVPAGVDRDAGGGVMNAYKAGTEFGVPGLALGLSITENDHPGALARLIAGEYDAEIHELGVLIGLHRGTTYLRIGYEFDGAWNKGYEQPQRYVQAYRRIVDLLRRDRVANVEFVWQASASSVNVVIDHRHKDIRDWFPGDGYVDWMGLSWFMHPDATIGVPSDFQPPTPRQLANELVDFARERQKPVMIAESAPQAYDLKAGLRAHHVSIWDGPARSGAQSVNSEQIWDAWFRPLFVYLDQNLDVIRALAYINCNWDAQAMWGSPYANGFWGDSRLETNPEVARRFSAAIQRWREQP